MANLSKPSLVSAVYDRCGGDIRKKDVDMVISEAIEEIQETVANGGKVSIVGFGAFEAKTRKARQGRNPKTGESLQIAERVVPAFKAGKVFKDLVLNR